VNKLKSELSIYLRHRIGAALGFAGTSLFVVFLTENQPVLDGALGKASFFWAWGLIMTTIPLITGLSRRDSIACFLFILLLMGGCGALAFVLPIEALLRVLSILTITLVLVMMLLRKSHRKSFILDLKPNVSPYTFAESLVIFAISWICASTLQFLGVVSGLIGSSPVATNLFFWMVFFVALSVLVMVAHLVKRK
jgi:hypothetical protein